MIIFEEDLTENCSFKPRIVQRQHIIDVFLFEYVLILNLTPATCFRRLGRVYNCVASPLLQTTLSVSI